MHTDHDGSPPASAEHSGGLRRSLSLIQLLFLGVGGMVGAGIYAVTGVAAGVAGNLVWLSFALAALVSLATATAYAEFASRFPDAGGSFEYMRRAFGDRFAFSMSAVVLLTGVVAAAAISISFADYVARFVDVPTSLVAPIALLAMAGVNLLGMDWTARFSTVATVVTLLGLGFVVAVSVPMWGERDLLDTSDVDGSAWLGVLSGGALVFFAHVGYEDLVRTAEEAQEPERNVPRAVVWSGGIASVVYLVTVVSAVQVLGGQRLADSPGPLAEVVEVGAGAAGAMVLAAVALFATTKTMLSNLVGASRLLFDVARDSESGTLRPLTRTLSRSGAPIVALLVATCLAIGFALSGGLGFVIALANMFVFVVFLVVDVGLIVFRLRNPHAPEPAWRSPGTVRGVPVLPVLGVLGTLVLMVCNIRNLIVDV